MKTNRDAFDSCEDGKISIKKIMKEKGDDVPYYGGNIFPHPFIG